MKLEFSKRIENLSVGLARGDLSAQRWLRGPGLAVGTLLLLCLGLGWGCRPGQPKNEGALGNAGTEVTTSEGRREIRPSPVIVPRRIVSMAPSITETLCALGCEDRLIAVTDFCEFPPEVRNLPRVGGYLNPNLEAVVRLKPDLVIAPAGGENLTEKLRQLGLEVLTVDHRSVEGLFASLTILGERLAVKDQAQKLAHRWREQLDAVSEQCRGRPRPRVLLVVDRPLSEERLEGLCGVGRDGFLDEMIEIAGGKNVLEDSPVAFPVLSAEGVLRLDPEVIVDIQAGKQLTPEDHPKLLRAWQQVKEVSAVRNRRVYLLGNEVPVVPGPRMVELAKALARCFHPEVYSRP